MASIKDITVLIIDDNVDFHTVATATLERSGYRVMSLYHGQLENIFASVASCNIVLLDIDLPGTTGTQITQQLKASQQFSALPIILISGNADLESLSKQSCADGFLGKPFSGPQLLNEVERLLAARVTALPCSETGVSDLCSTG
jgi:CheY-like chemotaxis protein